MSKMLVREFARLRWGVFDETGYKDDPVFPLYYPHARRSEDEPSFLPNFCTDIPITGEYMKPSSEEECKKEEEGGECHYVPDYLQAATSSLMSNHHLSSVETFCDSDMKTHTPWLPTRHNLECGQPVWDIISKHPDLEDNKTEMPQGSSVVPRFTVVREVEAKYVIALDTTSAVIDSKATALRALQGRLRQWLTEEVNDRSLVGYLEYGISSERKALRVAGEGNTRTDLIASIENPKMLPGDPCYICAVRYALMVLRGHLNNSVILFVGSGQAGYMTDLPDDVLQEVNARNTRLLCLVLDEYGEGTPRIEQLAKGTIGKVFYVKPNHEAETVDEFVKEATLAQPRTSSHVTIVLQNSTFQGSTGLLNGSFGLDEGLDKDPLNLTLTSDYYRHITIVPYLLGPSNQRIATEELRGQNVWTVSIANPEVGLWFWEVGLSRVPRHRVTVKISARASSTIPLQVEAWMNTKNHTLDASAHQLVLYTRVTRNESPVTGAYVRLLVRQGSDTGVPKEVSSLLDVGAGVDSVAGDGIYSRAFSFKEDSIYFFRIEVSSNGSAHYKTTSFQHPSLLDTRYPTVGSCPAPPSEDPARLCCGSVVPSSPEHELPTQPFNRVLNLGALKVTGISGDQATPPPSRVKNLQVVRAWVDSLSLIWTAPGGQHDRGNVSSYEFLLTTRFEDLPKTPEAAGTPHLRLTCLTGDQTEPPLLPCLDFGQPANLTLNLTEHLQEKRLYYLILRSKNEAGKTSAPSNIVRLVLEGSVEDEEEVEGGRGDGRPSLPFLNLPETGMRWHDFIFVIAFVFCLLSCMC